MSDQDKRDVNYALTNAREVAERLGLLRGGRRVQRNGANGIMTNCPSHGGFSFSITPGSDGTLRYSCFGCQLTGDLFDLIGLVFGLDAKGKDFSRVLREGAEMAGLWEIVAKHDDRERRPRPERKPLPPPPAEPERTYPDAAEVSALWSAAIPTADDPAAAAHLRDRGLDPDDVDARELARVIPLTATAPRFAAYQRRTWIETGHRLIVPVYGPEGTLVAVRGWRIDPGESPKRLPASGHRADGLVMANDIALAMLGGTFVPARVVVAEGEPDFLACATRRAPVPTAVLGIYSGSWSPELADRIPGGAAVIVRTDNDAAGEKYADAVVDALRWRCRVLRWRASVQDGERAPDQNDLLKSGRLPDDLASDVTDPNASGGLRAACEAARRRLGAA